MRILCHDASADFAGIAYQIQKEGTEINLFVKDKFYRNAMDSLIPKVETMEEGLKISRT